jgi:hypothetical protein
VRHAAEDMLAAVSWRPDPVLVMDLCESDGKIYLLELNSFSCSGLYACDLDAVVEAASKIARSEWERRRAIAGVREPA